ncbi:MAG: GMC family oxidoreductase N-terminal domain-containing protein, partial [Rhodobacteraceae bacterium]|nr:GMC family oxidoreductase N-terminal domain-containing protein [Paracoccaceae bacterium]
MKKFDYIIVGAGSAGCVLANRLGKNLAVKILILEAGPMDYNLLIHVPAGVYSVYKDPKINWNYKTEAENFALDRSIDTPRGKVIGGSSSVNSNGYMRGHPLDYQARKDKIWLKRLSVCQGLPFFQAGERSDRGGDDRRGGRGDL